MSPIRCFICDKPFEPADSPAMPFCGHRCRQIDLGRWFDERYGFPHEPEDDREGPWDADIPADKPAQGPAGS